MKKIFIIMAFATVLMCSCSKTKEPEIVTVNAGEIIDSLEAVNDTINADTLVIDGTNSQD